VRSEAQSNRSWTSARGLLTRALRAGLPALALVIACSAARADVGVLLNESLDTSVARITGSGHSAVYFSRICPDGPVKLRLCRADEKGSVMSNYTTLGEDRPFEWNVVPLSIYLYGVEDPAQQPVYGSQEIKHALEERYRENHLTGYCEGKTCLTGKGSEWREMVGATLERSVYIFIVATTVEQDQELIAKFNSLPNENHFNGATRNCADFTRRVINSYFPHAVSPDYLNDFGMTSPKAIARFQPLRDASSGIAVSRAPLRAVAGPHQAQQRGALGHRATLPLEKVAGSHAHFRGPRTPLCGRFVSAHRPLQSGA
jgi:hypothetical protein